MLDDFFERKDKTTPTTPKKTKRRLLQKLFSADLVVLARSSNPIPFRTRPLIFSALMVLSLKAWESKSLPDLPKTVCSLRDVECLDAEEPPRTISGRLFLLSDCSPAMTDSD
jgi:hypothetical protein